MSDLQDKIGSLSAAEKFELLDVLWESLEADPPALTDDQRAELDYRVARYKQNRSDRILRSAPPRRSWTPWKESPTPLSTMR
jgi:putative addiction module component (TIGR02574 family)